MTIARGKPTGMGTILTTLFGVSVVIVVDHDNKKMFYLFKRKYKCKCHHFVYWDGGYGYLPGVYDLLERGKLRGHVLGRLMPDKDWYEPNLSWSDA